MAATPRIARAAAPVLFRIANPEWEELRSIAFRRYPNEEWATLIRVGWRESPGGLVVTLAGIERQLPGDLDSTVSHVAFQEPYTLRTALAAEQHRFGVGVVHSHPRDCPPLASHIDDDMDGYYAEYFGSFAPDRPYASLILSEVSGALVASGRVFWRRKWHEVKRFAIERTPVTVWRNQPGVGITSVHRVRVARLADAFGDEAALRLRSSTVAVIGAGGSGSAAIEVLARAGVGRLILVDPDSIEVSNLERIHGSRPQQVVERMLKVSIAKKHVHQIDSSIEVTALCGALPQKDVVDAIIHADVLLGCTDQQHSRLALSDISVRYLLPSLDTGVLLEGDKGAITAQVIQLVRFLPSDPCALCRSMIVPTIVAQELCTPEEARRRREAALMATERGEEPARYWQDMPQLNTVGFLTTTAGSMAAGYAIGWITGRFDTPFTRLQLNLAGTFVDVADSDVKARDHCVCRRIRGGADQCLDDALISPPKHWAAVREV